MASNRRSWSSASSSRGRGTTAMISLEPTRSLQPWACSSLSSSEKFLGLYEKMQEDREKKNFESLVCAPCLEQEGLPQEEQQQFPVPLPPTTMMIDKPGSKTVLPHFTSRGSLVGKKVYCRTSIHSTITWRQKSSTQRMCTSLMIHNFYQDRFSSSNSLLHGGKQQQIQSLPAAAPADSVPSQKKFDHTLDKEQCRGLLLSLAGAAGMRLICPPLQLPLLEILLFFRQQLSSNRADLSEEGQGLWRFPVNLVIATLRPFCGSLAGRCLTALLCLAQMRIKKNNYINAIEQQNLMRYMSLPADLYSVAIEKECDDLDRKEFTTLGSTNHFYIDDLVVVTTDADGDVEAADRAGRNKNNHDITRLSNVLLGRKFEEECWSNNGLQVLEIFISDREERLLEDNVPNFLAKNQNNNGSEPGRAEDSTFSFVDLEEENLSPKPLRKQKESEELSSETGLVVTSGHGLHVAVEEAMKESFAKSDAAVSCPALQFPSEIITVVKTATDWPGTLCALEDSEGIVAEQSMPLTDGLRLAEEEQAEPTCNPKTCIVELAGDDVPRSPPAVVVESLISIEQAITAETVEYQSQLGNEFHDWKFAHFVEGESADRLVEQELDVCCIDEHRIEEKNCVSSEGLQLQVEVSLPERNSAENEREKKSSDNLEFEMANVMVPVESLPLALGDTAENQSSKEVQEAKSELCVVVVESADRVLDCSIEERIGSSDCVGRRLPDLIELLMEANWIGARKEIAKAAITVPVEKSSPTVTDLAEDQLVKKLQEGKSTFFVQKSAVKALNQVLEDCPIKIQAVREIQNVKSEHCSKEKLEDEEHRIGGDDCDDWLDSLLEQVEAFISERADALTEHERAAVTEAVENGAVKDIQEVNFTHPVEGKSPENVLDDQREGCPIEEYRIDDRNCAPLERLQGCTEVFLSSRPCSENGLEEKNSPTAGAVTENTEKEVKEIQEVIITHSMDEKSACGVLSQHLEVCIMGERITGDRDCEFLERLQRDCNVFSSDRTSAENDLEKGVSSRAAVALSVEIPSHALTECFEDQPIKEIHEVKSSHFVAEKSAEGNVNQEVEVSPIEGHEIEYRKCELLEKLQVQVDERLPERTITENEAETALTDGDAHVPLHEESNCPSSRSQESSTGQEHDFRPSTVVADDDSKSEDMFSSNYSAVVARESCLEHPESKLISWTVDRSSEPSAQTSSTSRLNTATEAVNKAIDPDSGTIAVVLDDDLDNKLNRDERDRHSQTKAKVLDEIKSGSIIADGDSKQPAVPTETEHVPAALVTTVVSACDENCNLDQSCAEAEEIGVNGENSCFPGKCLESSPQFPNLITESSDVPQGYPEHPFADHPTCIELRERRHSHGDQIYLSMPELLPAPWGQLIFWHGRCNEGRPTLCVLLGKAVRQLPGHELKNFIEVTVSHLEYAELNFFKGNVKQMNILMDLEGLGFMRLPPMHILSAIGAILNRDYAGRGGWIILVNAPLMLGFVISAIQGVILRPANNKGAAIDSSFKGFLEGKERIMMMGGKYRSTLQKHFDSSMLPVSLGGDCPCGSDEEPCRLGNEFLKLQCDTNSIT